MKNNIENPKKNKQIVINDLADIKKLNIQTTENGPSINKISTAAKLTLDTYDKIIEKAFNKKNNQQEIPKETKEKLAEEAKKLLVEIKEKEEEKAKIAQEIKKLEAKKAEKLDEEKQEPNIDSADIPEVKEPEPEKDELKPIIHIDTIETPDEIKEVAPENDQFLDKLKKYLEINAKIVPSSLARNLGISYEKAIEILQKFDNLGITKKAGDSESRDVILEGEIKENMLKSVSFEEKTQELDIKTQEATEENKTTSVSTNSKIENIEFEEVITKNISNGKLDPEIKKILSEDLANKKQEWVKLKKYNGYQDKKYIEEYKKAKESYDNAIQEHVNQLLLKGEQGKIEAKTFILEQIAFQKETGADGFEKIKNGVDKGLKAWENFGADRKDENGNEIKGEGWKKLIKTAVNISMIGGGSLLLGKGLNLESTKNLLENTGAISFLQKKLFMGLGFATIAQKTNPKYQKYLKYGMIGIGAGLAVFGAGSLLAVGGSAVVGELVRKGISSKWFSQKSSEEALAKVERENDFSNVSKFMAEYGDAKAKERTKRIGRTLLSGLAGVTTSVALMEASAMIPQNDTEAGTTEAGDVKETQGINQTGRAPWTEKAFEEHAKTNEKWNNYEAIGGKGLAVETNNNHENIHEQVHKGDGISQTLEHMNTHEHEKLPDWFQKEMGEHPTAKDWERIVLKMGVYKNEHLDSLEVHPGDDIGFDEKGNLYLERNGEHITFGHIDENGNFVKDNWEDQMNDEKFIHTGHHAENSHHHDENDNSNHNDKNQNQEKVEEKENSNTNTENKDQKDGDKSEHKVDPGKEYIKNEDHPAGYTTPEEYEKMKIEHENIKEEALLDIKETKNFQDLTKRFDEETWKDVKNENALKFYKTNLNTDLDIAMTDKDNLHIFETLQHEYLEATNKHNFSLDYIKQENLTVEEFLKKLYEANHRDLDEDNIPTTYENGKTDEYKDYKPENIPTTHDTGDNNDTKWQKPSDLKDYKADTETLSKEEIKEELRHDRNSRFWATLLGNVFQARWGHYYENYHQNQPKGYLNHYQDGYLHK